MSLKRVRRSQSIRGNPKCRNCGVEIKELCRQGKPVYSKKAGKRENKYYCGKCKADIFEGVKLRNE